KSRPPPKREGRARGGHPRPAGGPGGATGPAVANHGQYVGQRARADRVDTADPALLGQRPDLAAELGAIDDLAGAEALQVVGLAHAARRGNDVVTELGQERDRHRPEAAGCPSDHTRAALGGDPRTPEGPSG